MGHVLQAAAQAWPAFVLVTGLLLIGAVVQDDGVFEAVGARVERVGGGPHRLLAAVLAVVAVVTALLNLDTAVVFLTPIALHAARQRGCDERPFLYGTLFMANGASLLLPGSNLTNLIVLAHEQVSGAAFFRAMALPWLVVVAVTIAFVAVAFRSRAQAPSLEPVPSLRLGVGIAATAGSTVLILVLHNPALPVLAIGVAAVAARRLRPNLDARVLAGLFLLAVALGTLGRSWDGPARLLRHLGGVGAAVAGAGASVLLNNLPAATLLSAKPPPHPLPLLIGLNLGPNLLFTGSLAYYLWYRVARSADARPVLRDACLLGLALVPITMTAALVALAAVRP